MKTVTFDEALWRLVPVEPTANMLLEGFTADCEALRRGPDGATYEKPLDPHYTTEPAKAVAHISAETLSILSKGLGGLFRMSIGPSTKEAVPLYATPPSPASDLREALEVAADDLKNIQTLNSHGASDQTYVDWLRSNAKEAEARIRKMLA